MRLQDCATRRHRSGRVLVLNAGRALWNKWARGLALGLGIGLAGCAYHGSFDDPIQRRFQWFSFIGGDDIKAACRPGSSASIDRYRFVYNGRYAEQLRAYELVGDGAGGAYLTARATGSYANLAHVTLDDPLGPLRWKESRAQLGAGEFNLIRQALDADGFPQPPKTVGRRFSSDDFYWLVSGCREGQFHFGAWIYPSQDFLALHFPALLLARDRTGLAFNKAHVVPYGETTGSPSRPVEEGANAPFNITIRADGVGGGTLF
jgi:hypothetical protein